MSNLKILFALFLLLGTNNIFGQEKFITETETHIFWQPDVVLTEDDFQGKVPNDTSMTSLCEKKGICTVGYYDVCSVLDIPKRKRKRGKLLEKAYFAPVFEKTTSYIMNGDTTGIKNEKIIFDIKELVARYARKELVRLQKKMEAYGTISIMFKSVEADSKKMEEMLISNYVYDLYTSKKEGAYEDWRKKIDTMLEETKEFTTKPEDCHRFATGKPIDKNYKMAKKIIGAFGK